MLRWIGFVFLAAGLAALAWDVLDPPRQGPLGAFGERWAGIHLESLLLLQPAVERHVHPAFWSHGIQPLLEWPLAVELLALGALLLVVGVLRRRRRRVSRSA